MKPGRIRIGELPYSFFGGGLQSGEQRRLYQQLQANNDHLMNELRKVAQRLNVVAKQVEELVTLIDSSPET